MIFGFRHKLPDDFFQGACDVHCHLLPGVDDGFATTEKSLHALQKLEERGVQKMILTPHFMKDYPLNNRASISAEFETFKAAVYIFLHIVNWNTNRYSCHIIVFLKTL